MSLLDEVDRLYEGCVMEPERWGEQAFTDWAEGAAQSEVVDRDVARRLRRCLTAARRLADFWRSADRTAAPADWRARVDMALGIRAWRPELELAEELLERRADAATFERVAELFPVVTNQPFLDGIDHATWLQDREPGGPGGTIGG